MTAFSTLPKLLYQAFDRFVLHDGWAIASHIALSVLMSLFPFLILITALAGFLGTKELADEAARLMIEAWPKEVAAPIASEITTVLTNTRTDALTVGAVLAVYFASSGVESLRIGLNRAYAGYETRHWLILRLESIGFVLLGAAAILALAFLVVLAPIAWRALLRWLPALAPFESQFTFYRLAIATSVIVVALAFAHKVLPAGRRSLAELWPGIAATLLLWLVGGIGFGRYLDDFAWTYASTYAGLATGMVALVFLYLASCIFLFGAELNAVNAEAKAATLDAATA